MAIQLGVLARNARLDSIETTVGVSPLLILFTGAQPANCAAADSGTRCAVMTLPVDFFAAASGGSMAKSGTWSDASADNAGTIAHFRLKNGGDTVCHIQGSVTITGGGGDLTLDNNVVAVAQAITITTFTLTDGNA